MTLIGCNPNNPQPMEEPSHDDSWRQWFQQNGPRLLLCARLWTRSQADAEDVVQEAFVRFWKGQRHLGGDPGALVLTSIRRAAIDLGRRETRRARREQSAGEEGDDAGPWFETAVDGAERQETIAAALRRLPDEQREVLALKIWGELTFAQIAGQLDVSPNTVASRYRYALAALRRELTPLCHG
jgi:RNA polymerase sigma-70 factor, ECF subfamily